MKKPKLTKNLEKLIKKNLEEMLLEQNIFEMKKLQELSITSEKRNIPIEQFLVENGLLKENKLAQITCKNLNLPFLPINNINISENLVKSIPHSVMKKYLVFPINIAGGGLTLAICSPPKLEMLEDLKGKEFDSLFFVVDFISCIQKNISKIESNAEGEKKTAAIGTTDVWETIFDKADNEIMSEIMEKTHERQESPLEGTQNREGSPLNTEVSSMFPEAPEVNHSSEINSALSSVFGEEEISHSSQINSALSSVFGDEEIPSSSSMRQEIEESDDVLVPTISKTKQQIEELITRIETNPLDKEAVSKFVELAIANDNVEVATQKLAEYGRALVQNKEYSEAQKCYESILVLDPSNEEANNFLS